MTGREEKKGARAQERALTGKLCQAMEDKRLTQPPMEDKESYATAQDTEYHVMTTVISLIPTFLRDGRLL